jgi:cytoskeletal protein RodZ
MLGRFAAQPPAPAKGPKGFDSYELRLGDMMRGERATLGKSLLDVERDLRIKLAYLSAIEDGNPAAFDTPSFIAGYVRSYARYLGLNPDDSFVQFCSETGFVPAHGLSPAASTAEVVAVRAKNSAKGGSAFNPSGLVFQSQRFGGLEPGMLGSIAVLIAVMCGLGYGGLSLLRQVQMVQLSPIDQTPAIVVDVPDALETPNLVAQNPSDLAIAPIDPVAQAGLTSTRMANAAPNLTRAGDANAGDERAARAAQPQALDVPILIARDGPISAIDPRISGALATADAAEQVQVVTAPQVVEVLAVRPSWISVTAADGTVLFEKILDAGERYAVPALNVAPRLKAGNSSAVYFVMGDQTFGPASRGPEVVRDVDLSVTGLQGAFDLADLSLDADLTSYVAENAGSE